MNHPLTVIGKALDHDVLRNDFAGRDFERALRAVIGEERFGASATGWLALQRGPGRF